VNRRPYDRGVSVDVLERSLAAPDGDPDESREPAPKVTVPESIRRRLQPYQSWTWTAWGAAIWVTLIAGILRFVNLSRPNSLVFDEVYYATEGQQMLDHGVEWRTATDSAGAVTASYGDFVVHPPLGKWMISLGIFLFGNNSFGWRFVGAVCGTLTVLIMIRTANRLFRSTVLACLAGLFIALDGFHLVLSRTAILDIFVLFWTVVAFACLVLDRDDRRRRWLRMLEEGLDPTLPGRAGRPRFSWRSIPWWRIATGIALGAGCGVKWSVVWYVPVFAFLIICWGVSLRRTVGFTHPWRDTLIDEGGWIMVMFGLVFIAYLSTWSGWFLTDTGWKRHYLANELHGHEYPIIGALYNLYKYHVDVLNFHNGLTTPHVYQSWPWQWPVIGRPVAFWWSSAQICGAPSCAAEIILIGTPALWWAFIPAAIATTWFGISRRDWRALPLLLCALAGIVPWVPWEWADRTMFYFYAAPAEPFMVLMVVYTLGCLIKAPAVAGRPFGIGRWRAMNTIPPDERRLYGIIFAAAYTLLVVVCFGWFYPLYVGNSIPYGDWAKHMLLGNRWV
jgi:dolichyl-phosphate-mannose--protein O-mannosyl transferase